MNLINLLFDKSHLPENSLTLGGAFGLWDIARNKITSIPIYIILLKQSNDKDLKKHLNTRINTVCKQIETIRKLFMDKGFEPPEATNLESKINDQSTFTVSNVILGDKDIAASLGEHLRAVLNLETEALRNTTIPEVRNLIYDILKADNKVYGAFVKLQKEKNWLDSPPTLLQQ